MSNAASEKSGSLAGFVLIVGFVLVLVLAFAFLQRRRFPEGSFLHQQRTQVTESQNPDLAEAFPTIVPGETSATELVERFGEPTAKVAEDGLDLWVYTTRTQRVTERRLLGIVPTGRGSAGITSQMPVGVRDGMVVHTSVNRSEDAAVRQAIERMWDAYASGR